jgi:hypothetical protein
MWQQYQIKDQMSQELRVDVGEHSEEKHQHIEPNLSINFILIYVRQEDLDENADD